MRNKTLVFYTVFFLLVYSLDSSAQNIRLDRFNVFSDKRSVQLAWTISAGSLCDGTTIYRSDDSTNYKIIGFIDGVCGSADDPVGYVFTDTLPIPNKITFYKILLGNSQFSDSKSVIFRNSDLTYLVYPIPSNNIITFWINKLPNEEFSFSVYDLSGHKMIERWKLKGDTIIISRSELGSGIYHMVVSFKNGIRVTGEIIFID